MSPTLMLPMTGVAMKSGAKTAASTKAKYQTRNATVMGNAKPRYRLRSSMNSGLC